MKSYMKTILAALGALCGGAAVASQDGWTQPEFWTVLGAVVVQAAAVYAVPNKDPEGAHQDESVQPPDGPQD